MDEAYLEEIRNRFFKATKIDLKNLEPGEIHDLLELLPEALIYIHREYFSQEGDPDDA